jgi:hypothetical protein
MPKLNDRFPKKCRDRNQCFSWHNGKRIYFGTWGSPEAEKNYKRFIAALLENAHLPPQIGDEEGVLIAELCDAFLELIESSSMDKADIRHFKTIIGYLVKSYGMLPGNESSPKN